jgi:hypothetical protein
VIEKLTKNLVISLVIVGAFGALILFKSKKFATLTGAPTNESVLSPSKPGGYLSLFKNSAEAPPSAIVKSELQELRDFEFNTRDKTLEARTAAFETLQNGTLYMQHRAMQILGQYEEKATTDKLMEYVEGSDPNQRLSAIQALSNASSVSRYKLLLSIASEDKASEKDKIMAFTGILRMNVATVDKGSVVLKMIETAKSSQSDSTQTLVMMSLLESGSRDENVLNLAQSISQNKKHTNAAVWAKQILNRK